MLPSALGQNFWAVNQAVIRILLFGPKDLVKLIPFDIF